jgi:hypothetical protein
VVRGGVDLGGAGNMRGRVMKRERKREIYQMLESYQQTDNSNLDSEKTGVVEELLMEVERLEKERASGGGVAEHD